MSTDEQDHRQELIATEILTPNDEFTEDEFNIYIIKPLHEAVDRGMELNDLTPYGPRKILFTRREHPEQGPSVAVSLTQWGVRRADETTHKPQERAAPSGL